MRPSAHFGFWGVSTTSPQFLQLDAMDVEKLSPEDRMVAWHLAKQQRDSKLDPTTKVYRIADFFSVAQMLERQKLWLTRVSAYEDLNEGIDRLVAGLFVAGGLGPHSMRFGAHDEMTTDALVRRERASHFVSCWSINPESVAMWSMYSPDRASIKLQTTVGNLQELCARAVIEDWKLVQRKPDVAPRSRLAEARVVSAHYEDLHDLAKRLSRRAALAQRLIKAPPQLHGKRERTSGKQWFDRLRPALDRGVFLKHRAYAYEQEVRVSIRVGWEESMKELAGARLADDMFRAAQKGDQKDFEALIGICAAIQTADEANGRSQLVVSMPEGMFQSACVDPRAPAYKRQFIENVLQRHGVEVTESHVFGVAHKDLSGYPDLP